MTSPKIVSVKATDLRDAFEFVSMGAPFEHEANICRDTGQIYLKLSFIELEEEDAPPDDLEDADRYIAVPHKNDLQLGRRLVLAFIDQELPDESDTVARYFRRRGAYGRFKELLHARGMLQKWYEFENLETEKALLDWCEENDIQLIKLIVERHCERSEAIHASVRAGTMDCFGACPRAGEAGPGGSQ